MRFRYLGQPRLSTRASTQSSYVDEGSSHNLGTEQNFIGNPFRPCIGGVREKHAEIIHYTYYEYNALYNTIRLYE